MSFYPECAATPEDEGANFEPPILGIPYQRGQKRLREAQAFSKVHREAHEFHERKARAYGLDTPNGLAHFKAARAYREAGGRLQEMFDAQNQGSQVDPKAAAKAHKAAIKFHKGQAQKAGLDSPLGQAHVATLQNHMGALQNLKSSAAGHSSKQSPVPVPKKADQPNGDIRQNLPPQPLSKLQQNTKREAAIRNFGRKREGGQGPYDNMDCTPVSSDRKQMKPDLVFRGKKQAPGAYGPKAAKPQIHGGTDQKGGTLDRESRRSLRRRPIWESDDSEWDRTDSGLTA